MRVLLRMLTRPLHWIRRVRALKTTIVTQQQQILNQQQQLLNQQLQLLELQRATIQLLQEQRLLETTLLQQQQQILDLQRERKTELAELHRSCILAAIHTIEGQQALEVAVQRLRLKDHNQTLEHQRSEDTPALPSDPRSTVSIQLPSAA